MSTLRCSPSCVDNTSLILNEGVSLEPRGHNSIEVRCPFGRAFVVRLWVQIRVELSFRVVQLLPASCPWLMIAALRRQFLEKATRTGNGGVCARTGSAANLGHLV